MNLHGRPTVLDSTKKEVIYALLRVGASRRSAATVVGVAESTIRYALKHDEEFAQRVAQSETLLEVELLVKLRQNAGRSWRASAYALEKLRPERFADKPEKIDEEAEAQIERELAEMEAAAQKHPLAEADPSDPTTISSRRFQEQLEKILAASLNLEPTAIPLETKLDSQASILDDSTRSLSATLDLEAALRM